MSRLVREGVDFGDSAYTGKGTNTNELDSLSIHLNSQLSEPPVAASRRGCGPPFWLHTNAQTLPAAPFAVGTGKGFESLLSVPFFPARQPARRKKEIAFLFLVRKKKKINRCQSPQNSLRLSCVRGRFPVFGPGRYVGKPAPSSRTLIVRSHGGLTFSRGLAMT